MTVAELVERHPIRPVSLSGDRGLAITAISNPDKAEVGSIVFIEGEGPAADAQLARTGAGIIVRRPGGDSPASQCYIGSVDPRAWFIGALSLLYRPSLPAAMDPSARIDATAKLARDCRVGPFAVIEADVEVGAGSIIGTHSVILAGTKIGARAAIQHHVTIGSEGAAFHRDDAGQWHSFPHQGQVLIGDDVAIGSQSVIARGMLLDTIIGDGCKLGSLVNIGHNCTIGANCWLSAKVLVAGGAVLRNDVRLAASVSVRDRVIVGQRARVGMGSVVTKDVPDDGVVFGNPARPVRTLGAF